MASIPVESRYKKAYLKVNNSVYPLYSGVNTIGRDRKASVVLKDMEISHNQGLIIIIEDKHFISDLHSANHTYINGMKLDPLLLYPVENESHIKLANLKTTYHIISSTQDIPEPVTSEFTQNDELYAANTQICETIVQSQNYNSLLEDEVSFNRMSMNIDLESQSSRITIHEMPTQVFDGGLTGICNSETQAISIHDMLSPKQQESVEELTQDNSQLIMPKRTCKPLPSLDTSDEEKESPSPPRQVIEDDSSGSDTDVDLPIPKNNKIPILVAASESIIDETVIMSNIEVNTNETSINTSDIIPETPAKVDDDFVFEIQSENKAHASELQTQESFSLRLTEDSKINGETDGSMQISNDSLERIFDEDEKTEESVIDTTLNSTQQRIVEDLEASAHIFDISTQEVMANDLFLAPTQPLKFHKKSKVTGENSSIFNIPTQKIVPSNIIQETVEQDDIFDMATQRVVSPTPDTKQVVDDEADVSTQRIDQTAEKKEQLVEVTQIIETETIEFVPNEDDIPTQRVNYENPIKQDEEEEELTQIMESEKHEDEEVTKQNSETIEEDDDIPTQRVNYQSPILKEEEFEGATQILESEKQEQVTIENCETVEVVPNEADIPTQIVNYEKEIQETKENSETIEEANIPTKIINCDKENEIEETKENRETVKVVEEVKKQEIVNIITTVESQMEVLFATQTLKLNTSSSSDDNRPINPLAEAFNQENTPTLSQILCSPKANSNRKQQTESNHLKLNDNENPRDDKIEETIIDLRRTLETNETQNEEEIKDKTKETRNKETKTKETQNKSKTKEIQNNETETTDKTKEKQEKPKTKETRNKKSETKETRNIETETKEKQNEVETKAKTKETRNKETETKETQNVTKTKEKQNKAKTKETRNKESETKDKSDAQETPNTSTSKKKSLSRKTKKQRSSSEEETDNEFIEPEHLKTSTKQKNKKSIVITSSDSEDELPLKKRKSSRSIEKKVVSKISTSGTENTSLETNKTNTSVSGRGRKRQTSVNSPLPSKKGKTSNEESSSDTSLVNTTIGTRNSTIPNTTPRSDRSKRETKPRVVFTMLDSPELESIVKRLGGTVVDNVERATVLVTGSIKRTMKFLSAIGLGKPICSSKWLTESKKQWKFLDPRDYILEDEEAEEKWDFTLKESLERGLNNKLLSGYTFILLVNVAEDVLKGAIESCGGKCLIRPPANSNLIVVSVAENKSKYSKYLKQNVRVVLPEAIFDGVLRQEFHWDQHLLK